MTYPTLAEVMAARLEQITRWIVALPPPQTDVERTVRRRMEARRNELANAEESVDAMDRMLENGITIAELARRMGMRP